MKLNSLALALLAANLLSGCGGGGGSSGETSNTASTTLNGVASKGPLKAVLVTAYAVNEAGAVGAEIAHASSDGSDANAGAYSLNLGSYAGTVQLVVTAPAGAKTVDEATGQDVDLPSTFTLHANTAVTAPTGNQSQSASITPFTELANHIAIDSGGITSANIANANGVVFTLIGMDPVATVPLASNAAATADVPEVQKRYALFNAAISKLASSTPVTTDAATLGCFTAAAGNLGRRIECAVQQIAGSIKVSVEGATPAASVNAKMVGFSAALLDVAADDTINKTGASISSTDSTLMQLDAAETGAANGTPIVLTGGPITPARSDVASAKLFFAGLRSNAAAIRSDTVGTGIVDGLKAFGDSLKGEAATLTDNTVQVVELTTEALDLWTRYGSGLTTNPNTTGVPGAFSSAGCTVYQGTFPTQFGPANAPLGTAYVSASVVATAAANASWVGCSVNSGPLLGDGTRRYRQSLLFNMAADSTFAAVPYLASTRAQFVTGNTTYLENLIAALSGVVGMTQTDGVLSGLTLVGDLPPATTAEGQLLAQRHPVNFAGSLTHLANGATQAVFSHGQLGVVPVGASAVGLSIDLSPDGQSVAVIPVDYTNAAQLAAAKINFAATISDANGRLSGSLLFDQVSLDANGNPVLGHVKFTGDAAVAPVIDGKAGAVVPFLSGSIEATNGSQPVVSFSGTLTLPARPVASLMGSVTETSAGNYSLEGSYKQGAITVSFNGTRTDAGTAATFADSSGVSVSVSPTAQSATVTVGGRQAALIDKGTNLITYSDGTFESLI